MPFLGGDTSILGVSWCIGIPGKSNRGDTLTHFVLRLLKGLPVLIFLLYVVGVLSRLRLV